MRKLKYVLALGLLLAAIFLQAAAVPAPALAASAPIRVVYGFDREFPPFSYEDPGGKPVGFDVELIQAVLRDRVTLAMRPLDWFNVSLELSQGGITLTSGMIRTPQRAKTYGFSDASTFDLKIRFFTKVYRRVPNPAFLRGQSSAVEENSYAQSLLERFGGVNVKKYKTRALALRALYNDEVDAYCGPDESSYYYIRKLNYGAITTVGAPLGQAQMRIAVNRDRGDVLRLVNEGMAEILSNGEYDRIYRKWFITELDDQERDSLLKAAKAATISSYAPYGKMNYGAAVLTATGKVFAGCNVENAEPLLSLSALRAALARCVSENELELRAVVIVDQNGKVITPGPEDCQAVYEFGRGALILTQDPKGAISSSMVAQLLPNPVVRDIFNEGQ